MHLVIQSFAEQQEKINNKFKKPGIAISWFLKGDTMPLGDLYLDYCFEENGACFSTINHAPVLVNSVIETTAAMPANFVRMNGWNGFLTQPTLEIAAGNNSALTALTNCLNEIGEPFLVSPDIPGMISARVVAMIINEAYFGFGDGISSKVAIDIAMKLGTNYPYGPFEWSELIGLKKIYALLMKLSHHNKRYEIAPAMYKDL